MKKTCIKAILAAEASDSVEAFQSISDLGQRYLKPIKLPKYIPFPGELLSENGLIKISSTSKHDTPLQHRGVLRPEGGFFHTNKDEHPWVIARLAKIGELSGIVIINRTVKKYQTRQIPMVVSISEDGQQWQEIWETDKNQDVWRIDLLSQKLRAAYIKIETKKDAPDYFHLHNILVYGKRLQ